MALVITLSYMLIGRLNNDSDSWVQVSLPLSSASLLLISLSAAETYLYVQRVQRNHEELQAARVREIELSQRLAFQRQSTLNQISPALIDKLDVAQISQEVLEKIAQLFEADVVAAWMTEKNGPTHFALKGTFGFAAHSFEQLEAADWSFPAFEQMHTDPSSPTYRYVEATEASAHRGAALTKQLLAFARREGPHLTVINPNDCIEQTLKMLDRSIDKAILIQCQFTRDLHPIEVDPSQLEQVFLNIAVNARDAMPEGGIFTITTRNVHLEATDPFRPALSLPDGDYVTLGFRDTGCGMDAATLARVRAVLHHQTARQGHRAWTIDGAQHRER
jgi:signal transduction histidine kinase